MINIRVFYLKNFVFLEVKFSLYLNRRVFVMGRVLREIDTLSRGIARSKISFFPSEEESTLREKNLLPKESKHEFDKVIFLVKNKKNLQNVPSLFQLPEY